MYLDIVDAHDCSTVGEAEFCFYAAERRTFGEAQEFCKTKRGNLASIASAAEQTAVHDLMNSVSGGASHSYIGYIDNQATGTNWNWIDGKGGYTNWATGAPSGPSINLCAALQSSDTKWITAVCSLKLSFVCRIVSCILVVLT